jgi:hypothetical protein
MASASASTPRSRDDRAIVDLIVQHGGTEQAARAAVALAGELLARMAHEPDPDRQREHGGVVDAVTGERIGPISVGTRGSVSFAEQIRATRERGTASVIGVHTHPGSSSFSPADAGLFERDAIVAVMAAVGPDGSWYVLSPEPGTTPPPKDEIEERFETVLDHVAPTYRALIDDGTLPPDRAWQELVHEVWDIIAPALGLRYDRLTPGDDTR